MGCCQTLKELAVSIEIVVEIFNDGVADELEYMPSLQGKTDPAGPFHHRASKSRNRKAIPSLSLGSWLLSFSRDWDTQPRVRDCHEDQAKVVQLFLG